MTGTSTVSQQLPTIQRIMKEQTHTKTKYGERIEAFIRRDIRRRIESRLKMMKWIERRIVEGRSPDVKGSLKNRDTSLALIFREMERLDDDLVYP